KVRSLAEVVPLINALEEEVGELADEELANMTVEFKERLAQGEDLNDLLVEAFAVVREAAKRTIGQRHFDVQLMGGMALHFGWIAEMRTGEGKTLVSTLPVYLNALPGDGVHIVTVNDYLARRDAEWMSPIYKTLGLSVGVITHDLDDAERKIAYGADVTYGTNNEFGFDYLRDNMKYDLADCVQRDHHFCIVDEVDSILIDEARTPLIISGPAEESTEKYYRIDKMIPKLIRDIDFTVDEKFKTVTLTEEGVSKCERLLGFQNLYDPENIESIHHVYQALRAHALFTRDVDYVVKNGEVVIIDEFTGREMPGRRWSDGLHQAIEAKESVKIERENQTLATITFQNYFRMYKKLSGMTGTAETEKEEFRKIYGLGVVVIPTNKDLRRHESPDVVYRTDKEKWEAVVNGIVQEDGTRTVGIRQLWESGQPVLVGTISIEKSEKLAELLQRAGIPHQVLNAKAHEREAKVIAQAGRKHAITVATNMAGRGTDILLGGNPEFLTREYCLKNKMASPYASAGPLVGSDGESTGTIIFQYEGRVYQVPLAQWKPIYDQFAEECRVEHDEVVAMGGLHVLGTERHEARRIDNQLRGRAGRQGDPGSSRFFMSLEDDLLRIFGGDRIKALMWRLGMKDGIPIESKMISKRIENAQKSVEAQNFEARKHLLEYDDVMNKQRHTIYEIRRAILEGKDQKEYVLSVAEDIARNMVERDCPHNQHPNLWNIPQLSNEVLNQFGIDLKTVVPHLDEAGHADLVESLTEGLKAKYEEKEKQFGAELMRRLERHIILDIVDGQWKDHLLTLDHLKEGIGLRGYGQKDPLIEFKKEAFTLFEEMMNRMDSETVRILFLMQLAKPEEQAERIEQKQRHSQSQLQYSAGAAPEEAPRPVRTGVKIGRNDPCPCGSGKKYKKCCGKAA
ncbi:MAG TPA: preprotein translocase subunit SecA, partial [Candidatus Dormibacteraeota bacterium]|nr:preprotein translocase subunit SecA [Candidatus Dormibacteraeota bacterium]